MLPLLLYKDQHREFVCRTGQQAAQLHLHLKGHPCLVNAASAAVQGSILNLVAGLANRRGSDAQLQVQASGGGCNGWSGPAQCWHHQC